MTINKVVALMESELELSLEEISEKTGSSKRTLTRLVQDKMAMGPKELYTFFRVQSLRTHLLRSARFNGN